VTVLNILHVYTFFLCKLPKIVVFLFCVALVSGGVGMVNVLMNGADSVLDARFALTAPFFGLFVLVGFFGLLLAYNKRGSRDGFLGLIVTVFCYIFIEVLYNVCLGV
jgi:hypothetical protein